MAIASNVKGHPKALYLLFATEMWERLSYYGMRAILVLFLTKATTGDNPGLGWSTERATSPFSAPRSRATEADVPMGRCHRR